MFPSSAAAMWHSLAWCCPGLSAVMVACREEAIIDVFEQNTYSVANIFDITLQVQCCGSHLPAVMRKF